MYSYASVGPASGESCTTAVCNKRRCGGGCAGQNSTETERGVVLRLLPVPPLLVAGVKASGSAAEGEAAPSAASSLGDSAAALVAVPRVVPLDVLPARWRQVCSTVVTDARKAAAASWPGLKRQVALHQLHCPPASGCRTPCRQVKAHLHANKSLPVLRFGCFLTPATAFLLRVRPLCRVRAAALVGAVPACCPAPFARCFDSLPPLAPLVGCVFAAARRWVMSDLHPGSKEAQGC